MVHGDAAQNWAETYTKYLTCLCRPTSCSRSFLCSFLPRRDRPAYTTIFSKKSISSIRALYLILVENLHLVDTIRENDVPIEILPQLVIVGRGLVADLLRRLDDLRDILRLDLVLDLLVGHIGDHLGELLPNTVTTPQSQLTQDMVLTCSSIPGSLLLLV